MSRVCLFTTPGSLLALGIWSMISATPVGAQVPAVQVKPMQLTTDTPEYCLHLLDRISDQVRLATAPVPREVTILTTEGQRMCAHGQIRSGIARLRSAVMMMMERNDGPARR